MAAQGKQFCAGGDEGGGFSCFSRPFARKRKELHKVNASLPRAAGGEWVVKPCLKEFRRLLTQIFTGREQ
jgi:hypothetical protein